MCLSSLNQNHMKQSNTYHKIDASFGGILQPMVESLERNPLQSGKLVGQDIVIHNRADTQTVIALDASNNIHLLISPPADNDRRLPGIDLKGLKITNIEWTVAGRPNQLYLDVSCSTGTMPTFKRPFLRFAEDVLYEMSREGVKPADAVYITCLRWRKFWSPETGAEVTREWVHGLFGELVFLVDLIERFGSGVVDSWLGPLGKDQDFQKGTDLAVEVKTSTETPFSITCNIRQLDPDLFRQLFIVCYKLSTSETGRTLPEVVRQIESLLGGDESQLEKFYEKLTATGYQMALESFYNGFRMNHDPAVVYHVDGNFPKITEKSFVAPPDHRITGIRYTLQLTGVEKLKIDSIATQLKRFIDK